MLGYGPLKPLLARDLHRRHTWSTAPGKTFIEVGGKVEESEIRFRDNGAIAVDLPAHRSARRPPRRRIEPDLRCAPADGSRVNVIAPPLAIYGTALTIRKFKKDKLTLEQLVRSDRSRRGGVLLQIIGRVRCNIVISGAPAPERRRCSTA